jgi:hypothetical protein
VGDRHLKIHEPRDNFLDEFETATDQEAVKQVA